MRSVRELAKRLILAYLVAAARLQLAKLHPTVIAVGGAAGKTSTVAAIVAALSGTHRVRSGSGKNSETGVPLAMLGIHMDEYGKKDWLRVLALVPWKLLTDWKRCDVYVAEYGIDHPGDMRGLLKIRVPDIAVTTNVTLEHAGYWKGSLEEVLDQIADEELLLLESVSAEGTVVAYVDDPRIRARLPRIKARVVTVGSNEGADCELMSYAVSAKGTEIRAYCHGVTYPIRLPYPVSRASATSMLLAAAVAHVAGVPLREAFAAISRAWQVPAGRGRIFAGKHDRLLIDSSYNAAPAAMVDALHFLKDLAGDRPRVAILGDMRELGDHAPTAHELLVPEILMSADRAIIAGPNMDAFVAPLLRARQFPVASFAEASDLLVELATLVEPGEVVLVKGSQNTLLLERVTEALLADGRDAERLPRRGARWDAVRAGRA